MNAVSIRLGRGLDLLAVGAQQDGVGLREPERIGVGGRR